MSEQRSWNYFRLRNSIWEFKAIYRVSYYFVFRRIAVVIKPLNWYPLVCKDYFSRKMYKLLRFISYYLF